MFDKVWSDEKLPADWVKGIIVPFPKKGDKTHCSNYRGITLRSTTSKLFQIIILQRLSQGLETLYRDNQCGFRKNRSCVDQLYALRTIIHNCVEYNLPLFINFIDFKAAFDSIDRDFIWKAFAHYGLPKKYINIISTFFENTLSAVRVDGDISDWFPVKSGTGQGDIHGPPVFNVVINWIMELAIAAKSVSNGLTLQKRLSSRFPEVAVTDVDYADDLAVLDGTKEGLQESTDLIAKYSAYGGLKINVKKTNTMTVSVSSTQRPFNRQDVLDTTVYNEPIEQVAEFTYLGGTIRGDGDLDRELSIRIGKASGAFNSLNNIWKNRGISLHCKVRIYRAAVITILTYGCEVWSATDRQTRRLETFHQSCLRRLLKIRFFHHVTNAEVLRRAGTTPVNSVIAAARIRWYGHVARMPQDRLPNYLLNWKPRHGKRGRGIPRRSWVQTVENDLEQYTRYDNIKHEQAQVLAKDRRLWRGLTTGHEFGSGGSID